MCEHYHPLSGPDEPHAPDAGYTRRRFLQSGLTMVSAAATVPGFIAHAGNALADSSMRVSSQSGVPEDRVLVVIQLSGGNDGLNTVIPYGDAAYHRARPSLRVSEDDVLPLNGADGMGLHPRLEAIGELIDSGYGAVVQGVGYPNPNRSHFVSMDIWHTASPETSGGTGRGWIGRALDTQPTLTGLDCVSIGSEIPLATVGERSKAVAFEKPEMFRWVGRDLHGALGDAYDHVLEAPADGSPDDDPLAFVQRTAMDAQVASARVRAAVDRKAKVSFPRTSLGRQLELIAKMIRADLPTRVYYANHGGFDTHAGQGNTHPNLLGQFAAAVRAFHDELDANGDRSRVVTLSFSEFGRRVAQNASGGTDHGCAGPMFLFGDAVKPGVIGKHPSLTKLDNGDLVHTMDFRSVYADVLSNWMKMDAGAALGQRFKPAGVIRA